MSRDLSEREFWDRCEKYGMTRALMGYVHVTRSTSVYRYNGGNRRRDQLAYLLREREGAIRDENDRRATISGATP